MLFDWFTIGAQIVNFLILLWLLKRFLYGPILRAVDSREAAIAQRLREADAARDAAEEERRALARGREGFAEEKRQLMEKAREDVQTWRESAEERVRGEVEARRERWLESLSAEQAEFERALAERVAREVVSVSRRVLTDLGDADLEERLAEAFLREVRERRGAAVSGRVTVGTGADMGPEAQRRVAEGLRSVFTEVTEVDFTQASELGFGMRMETGDTRIGWTLSGYLEGLEQRVLDELAATPQGGMA